MCCSLTVQPLKTMRKCPAALGPTWFAARTPADTCRRLQAVVAAWQLAAQIDLGPIHKGMLPDHLMRRSNPRQQTRRNALTASLECQRVHAVLQDKMMQP